LSLPLSVILEKYSQLIQPSSIKSEAEITGLNSPDLAQPNELIFVSDAEHLRAAFAGASRFWVVQKKLAAAASFPPDVVVLTSPNPQLLMSFLAKDHFPVQKNKMPFDGHPRHPSACISAEAQIGKNVLIGPHATVSAGCVIEDDCIIGANTTLEADVKIGRGSHIHPQVFIGHSTVIGRYCEVHPQTSIGTEGYGYAHDERGAHHRITHYGKVILRDHVHIGAGVQIDRGTFGDSVIGEGTKIDNHCHFGHNIRIGKHTLVTGGMIVAGSTTLGSHCVFGGRTTIAGHLEVSDQVQIAGLSGVTKSIEKPGAYGGYPLQPLKRALKTTATLAHLPEMRKNLSAVMKALGLKEIESSSKD
jgi:UDP-3-O-[3-hydroxymyristoyl] glucosamine N-acyltransferase